MQAWIVWFIIAFHWVVGIFLLVASSWFSHMRGAGKLGAGKEVISIIPCPIGKAHKFRIVKKGSLYMQPADGGEAIITRTMGLFGKTEDMRIMQDQLISLDGDTFILDDKNGNAMRRIMGVEREFYAGRISSLKNELAHLHAELANAGKGYEEYTDHVAKLMKKLSDATMPRFGPGTKKKD